MSGDCCCLCLSFLVFFKLLGFVICCLSLILEKSVIILQIFISTLSFFSIWDSKFGCFRSFDFVPLFLEALFCVGVFLKIHSYFFSLLCFSLGNFH